MNIPYIMKRCSKCGEWKVASPVNFHRKKGGKYGVVSECKKCVKKRQRQYYKNNKEKVAERNKRYREANKEMIAERNKRWYEANKEKALEQRKQRYEANKEKELEQCKRYYEANKEKIAEYYKEWRQSPQGQASRFNEHHRRRVKEEQQGSGITKDQWLEMMSFFDFRCAYSGEYLGGNNNSFNRTIDHIVPLDAGGDNMIWNCVPMTRSLNCSKHTNNMEEWYKEQDCYDPKRLAKIYKWQEYAYNKYGKDTQYFNSGNIQIKLL